MISLPFRFIENVLTLLYLEVLSQKSPSVCTMTRQFNKNRREIKMCRKRCFLFFSFILKLWSLVFIYGVLQCISGIWPLINSQTTSRQRQVTKIECKHITQKSGVNCTLFGTPTSHHTPNSTVVSYKHRLAGESKVLSLRSTLFHNVSFF